MKRSILAWACWFLAAGAAQAELQVVEQTVDGGQLVVFKLRVTPAPEPSPALKHRLLIREIDEKAGNAAPMYYRAMMLGQSIDKELRDKLGDDYDNLMTPGSVNEIALDRVRVAVNVIDRHGLIETLREASLRRSCDWGFDLQSIRGPDLIAFLIPEVQESRQLTRFLALRARLAIAEGRFDDAIDNLRMNLKLARDVNSEPLLVSALVGLAQADVGNRVAIDLIAAPRSPNLYWALTEAPDPVVDMRPAIRFEMSTVLRIFPFLRDAETQEHSPEEWARLLSQGVAAMGPVTGGRELRPDSLRRAAVAGLGLTTYGPAKRRLVERGFDPTLVELMPVGQVIAIDAAQEYRRISDSLEKSWYLPYHMSRQGTDSEQELARNTLEGGYGRLLAAILLPSINAARTTLERHGWQNDGLRIVEAIRMHAAKEDALPARLDDIKVVPIPLNRATGKPYQYQLNGGTAVLELPFSDGFPGVAWRFEIQLAN